MVSRRLIRQLLDFNILYTTYYILNLDVVGWKPSQPLLMVLVLYSIHSTLTHSSSIVYSIHPTTHGSSIVYSIHPTLTHGSSIVYSIHPTLLMVLV